MKERPILFSGPMVRAIRREKNPKTQTRRLVRDGHKVHIWRIDSFPHAGQLDDGSWMFTDSPVSSWRLPPEQGGFPAEYLKNKGHRCPYGMPGDRLWVRESFRLGGDGAPIFAADVDLYTLREKGPWRPSIFLFREYARTLLEVTAVRVERLQDISAEDAIAEGLSKLSKDGGQTWKYGIPDRDGLPGGDDDGMHWRDWSQDPREAFAKAWDTINGKRCPWASNPWLWVVSFKRIELKAKAA